MKSIIAALIARVGADTELSALLQATPERPKCYRMGDVRATQYPCITFYTPTSTPHAEIKGEESQSYYLDIWATDWVLIEDIAARLDTVLTAEPLAAAGRHVYQLQREFTGDLGPYTTGDGTPLFRKTTRWRVDSIAM